MGLLEDGSWIRLYPVPFRKLDDYNKYKKYTWITVDVHKNTNDFRPETYSPILDSITIENSPKKIDWEERHKIIF